MYITEKYQAPNPKCSEPSIDTTDTTDTDTIMFHALQPYPFQAPANYDVCLSYHLL